MKQLLVATTNPGKQKEIRFFLQNLNIEQVFLQENNFLKDLIDKEPEESGKDLKENAIIKAMFYAEKTNKLTLADDTGLIVDVFPDKLGVRTHRYAKETELKGYERLLKEMKDIGPQKRTASFITVVALYDPIEKKTYSAKGESKGIIATKPAGKKGFGYDPVFIPLGKEKSFAQLSKPEKLKLSSRGKALQKIKKNLEKYES